MTDQKSQPPRPGYWRNKAGSNIPIKEIISEHLINIIRMLQRNAEYNRALKVAEQFKYVHPDGGAAQDAFDKGFDQLMGSTWKDFVPEVYRELEAEAILRGLEIPKPASLLAVEANIIKDLVSRKKVKEVTG